MKRRLARFLALMLALCLTPYAALAEDASTPTGEPPVLEALNDTPIAMAALGGELFAIFGWEGIFQKVDGGWKPVLAAAPENGSLDVLAAAVADDTLYLLTHEYVDEASACVIMRTRLENGALAPLEKAADVAVAIDENYYPQFFGMAADKDNVWFLISPDSGDWDNNDLYRVSLNDGKTVKLAREHLKGLTNYSEDKLLALYTNSKEEDPHCLVSVDKETEAIEKLCSLSGTQSYVGLTYDDASGFAYFSDDSHLYRYRSTLAEPSLCGYMPPHTVDSSCSAAVLDGMYYLPDWSEDNRVTSCSVDPSLLPSRVLRLSENWGGDDLLRGFCQAHPEIALETGTSSAYTAEDISRAMTSGDNSADIFSIYVHSSAYEALLRKGYFYDLSGSEILSDFAGRMYPHFAKVLTQDGKLCAIPIHVSAYSLGYFPKAFEKVGLTEADVPATMMEMLDFIQRWADDYADEYPEMQLFLNTDNLRGELFSTIFQMQLSHCQAQGEPLTFDTPVIRKLLARLEEISPALTSIENRAANGGEVFAISASNPPQLFTTYANLLPQRYHASGRDWSGYPMLLSLDEGMTPALDMTMEVYIVNPNSENLDLAVTFLEYMVEHMYQDTRIVLLPDENTPYQNEYYERNLKEYEDALAIEYASMAEAAEEYKADFQEQIEWLEKSKARVEADRWAISVEDIADYRAVAEYLNILPTNLFSGSNNEAASLMRRYTDGQMGAEQFIKEFSRIVSMSQLESQ